MEQLSCQMAVIFSVARGNCASAASSGEVEPVRVVRAGPGVCRPDSRQTNRSTATALALLGGGATVSTELVAALNGLTERLRAKTFDTDFDDPPADALLTAWSRAHGQALSEAAHILPLNWCAADASLHVTWQRACPPRLAVGERCRSAEGAARGRSAVCGAASGACDPGLVSGNFVAECSRGDLDPAARFAPCDTALHVARLRGAGHQLVHRSRHDGDNN